MTFQAWLLFCVTETILCFTPGPAVLLVVSTALTLGASAGLRACVGILVANAFYFVLSATGIGAVLLASWQLFVLIKWVGAAYLVWLGLQMLFARDAAPMAAPKETDDAQMQRAFRRGVITQGANPKALVFFSAILPQFIDAHAGVAAQVAILGVSSILIELCVLAVYVAVCYRARVVVQQPRFATVLNRAGGALLIGAGAGLASVRRP